MSSVERHGLMDNGLAMDLTEMILKEKKIQRKYFEQQEAAGKLAPMPPTPKRQGQTALQRLGVPQHVTRTLEDAESAMANTISKGIYGASNPGYIVRDGSKLAGTTHKDFAYDEEEIAYMKQQGFLDKTHNRRRDEFVMYVEAHAKIAALIKSPGGGGGGSH